MGGYSPNTYYCILRTMGYLKDRIAAFGYALKGLKHFFRNEKHAQIHLIATVLVLIAGFILNVNTVEWCILLVCIALVLSAEAFNSSIEQLTDITSPEKKPKAGLVKDLAAGAVLITALLAAIIGLIIFLPKILMLFNGSQ